MISTRSTIVGSDAVADAARAIPHEIYLGPEGDAVEPVVPRSTTLQDLRALDLRPNMRVLQVGTGSGYSTALMAHIVGPGGYVLTIDADEDRSLRARELFVAHGHRAISATGSGMAGHPGRAPYDRIAVAGTPAAIPGAWIDQLARGGVLVTGCTVSDLPDAYAVAHIVNTPTDDLHVTVHAGRYPLMEPPVVPSNVRVVTATDDSGYYLASASDDHQTAADFLAILRAGTAEPWPGGPGEFLDLKHWLLARRPAGLFTAVTEHGEGIGIGDRAPTSFGLAARPEGPPEAVMITPAHLVAHPRQSPIWARFLDLIDDWRAEGSLATHELDAVVLRDGDSYHVRLDD
ncbi:protein-L-isoaspartate O-methyltransferase [Promicromonospora sp. NPDC057138]|uniref:protein-L-isoaspartate O-methyltransferase family protein n=1 Tax=Promicromonospora sp. NPDC057138 TaxID=3346031 RepID=UPI0036264B03